ncbi:LodA/GoxA family CTQ-dependent oxidase [Xanthobacter sp. V4C-4]|uniref:LodA/GoxA family CTQ-dependent oxidase n=1 Tax=Xanthobacter cornucopiae TaxID=3119924 RepID=UPI0037269A90
MDRRDLLKGAAGTTLLAATAALGARPAAGEARTPAVAPERTILRIHPAIGVARVGNSSAYYLAPETAAGELPASGPAVWGGLPLDPDTGAPIAADDFRDPAGGLKRQAVRFRIHAYDTTAYPTGQSTEVTLGAVVNGRTVVDIVWQVHLANKKLSSFVLEEEPGRVAGLNRYVNGRLPPLRNARFGPAEAVERRRALVIDPGPRALSARSDAGRVVAFDRTTPATVTGPSGAVVPLPAYPRSFPADHFELDAPLGPIDTLGDMRAEAGTGRLVLAPGLGRTVGIRVDGAAPTLGAGYGTENDLWFDDIADGPVTATVIYADGSSEPAVGAWALAGDPGFAPQTRNVVTAWDEVHDTFVRELALTPQLYAGGAFNTGYTVSFDDDIRPFFNAVVLQRWNTNLSDVAVAAHALIGAITPADDPRTKIASISGLIRNPQDPAALTTAAPLMPLALGDNNNPYLTVTPTQYFMLRQWHAGRFAPGPRRALGAGEELDRVALANCLGGRFSPGIEVTFPVRDPNLYIRDWADTGPFRINPAPLDYAAARADQPFLGVGYIPLRTAPVEPGDVTKFMAVPWHVDYNRCALHPPNPNPNNDQTLYWSWPAERPVAVFPAALSHFDPGTGWTPGRQVFAIRGAGTATLYPGNFGRFQNDRAFVENWFKTGFVVQASRINPEARPPAADDPLLEVACGFETGPDDTAPPWPLYNSPPAP